MNPLFKKLGFTMQNPVLILNAPVEYRPVMADMATEIHTTVQTKYSFIQFFVTKMDEAVPLAEKTVNALEGNGYLWLCYPKKTSRKYKTDINRNQTWELFAPFNFEPVIQIAIDDDWTAMRFKHVDHIRSMNRKTAASEKGKERIGERNEEVNH